MAASSKIMIVAALLVAICAASTFCPMLISAEQGSVSTASEEITDESGTVAVTDEDGNMVVPGEGEMPELPAMDGGNIEMDGEEITLDDGTVLFVPYLPDGTLPEVSEDGTMPGEGMIPPEMNGENMPQMGEMDQMGMPGMGMNQMGGSDGS